MVNRDSLAFPVDLTYISQIYKRGNYESRTIRISEHQGRYHHDLLDCYHYKPIILDYTFKSQKRKFYFLFNLVIC